MNPSQVLVIDVGASWVKIGKCDDFEKPYIKIKAPQNNGALKDIILQSVLGSYGESFSIIKYLVIGYPGLVDFSGIPVKSLRYSGTNDIVPSLLVERFQDRIIVLNDATLNAYSFIKKYRSAAYVNIGTGVGGALIIEGQVVNGSRGFAGEIGHFPIIGRSELCSCGRIGCIEACASGSYFNLKYGNKWWEKPYSNDLIKDMYIAANCYYELLDRLALLLDPSHIIISGFILDIKYFTDELLRLCKNKFLIPQLILKNNSWQLTTSGALNYISNR